MKHIVLLGSRNAGSKNDVSVLADSLRRHLSGVVVDVCYWEDMVFNVAGEVRSVFDSVSRADFASVDLAICMNWYKTVKLAFYRDMAFTLALYLEQAGVAFWNSEMRQQRSTTKLSALMQLSLANIPVPKTVFSVSRDELIASSDTIGFPLIVKTIAGSRGVNNHLVGSSEELRALLDSDVDTPYMVEEFIPNDHDLRVVCYGGEPAMVIKRSRTSAKTHLNNTSQGAVAQEIPLAEVDANVLDMCRTACRILGREVAGVDILPANDDSGRMVCLEVNAIPQLTSGSYLAEKSERLAETLSEYLKG